MISDIQIGVTFYTKEKQLKKGKKGTNVCKYHSKVINFAFFTTI